MGREIESRQSVCSLLTCTYVSWNDFKTQYSLCGIGTVQKYNAFSFLFKTCMPF
jgi:hypothetical protein